MRIDELIIGRDYVLRAHDWGAGREQMKTESMTLVAMYPYHAVFRRRGASRAAGGGPYMESFTYWELERAVAGKGGAR